MQELIAKSKYYKAERQKITAENVQLCDDLNEEFTSAAKFLPMKMNNSASYSISGFTPDYDTILRDLSSQQRQAKATNRLKTPQEVALEEKAHIELLEQQRSGSYIPDIIVPELKSSSYSVPLLSGHNKEPVLVLPAASSLDAITRQLFHSSDRQGSNSEENDSENENGKEY